MYDAPIAQTPRRQRNGVYVNGTSVMRPASRDGSTYVRENSPAFAMPSLTRANTASVVTEMTVNKNRLPRQTTAPTGIGGHQRLSRQSTRESMAGSARPSADKDSNSRHQATHCQSSGGSTPVTLTPVAESRARREARLAHSSSISQRENTNHGGGVGANRREVSRPGSGASSGHGQVEVTVARRTTARRHATADERWG